MIGSQKAFIKRTCVWHTEKELLLLLHYYYTTTYYRIKHYIHVLGESFHCWIPRQRSSIRACAQWRIGRRWRPLRWPENDEVHAEQNLQRQVTFESENIVLVQILLISVTFYTTTLPGLASSLRTPSPLLLSLSLSPLLLPLAPFFSLPFSLSFSSVLTRSNYF